MNIEDALRFLVIVADKYATYLEDFVHLEDCKDEVEEIDTALAFTITSKIRKDSIV
jgi:hypothetical protein